MRSAELAVLVWRLSPGCADWYGLRLSPVCAGCCGLRLSPVYVSVRREWYVTYRPVYVSVRREWYVTCRPVYVSVRREWYVTCCPVFAAGLLAELPPLPKDPTDERRMDVHIERFKQLIHHWPEHQHLARDLDHLQASWRAGSEAPRRPAAPQQALTPPRAAVRTRPSRPSLPPERRYVARCLEMVFTLFASIMSTRLIADRLLTIIMCVRLATRFVSSGLNGFGGYVSVLSVDPVGMWLCCHCIRWVCDCVATGFGGHVAVLSLYSVGMCWCCHSTGSGGYMSVLSLYSVVRLTPCPPLPVSRSRRRRRARSSRWRTLPRSRSTAAGWPSSATRRRSGRRRATERPGCDSVMTSGPPLPVRAPAGTGPPLD